MYTIKICSIIDLIIIDLMKQFWDCRCYYFFIKFGKKLFDKIELEQTYLKKQRE